MDKKKKKNLLKLTNLRANSSDFFHLIGIFILIKFIEHRIRIRKFNWAVYIIKVRLIHYFHFVDDIVVRTRGFHETFSLKQRTKY